MKFKNIYFINGTSYAGKSTMVKLLAEKFQLITINKKAKQHVWMQKIKEKARKH